MTKVLGDGKKIGGFNMDGQPSCRKGRIFKRRCRKLFCNTCFYFFVRHVYEADLICSLVHPFLILSCKVINACNNASGRGGQPGI